MEIHTKNHCEEEDADDDDDDASDGDYVCMVSRRDDVFECCSCCYR